MQRKKKTRTRSGLTIAALVAFIAIFIMGPLSMFVFEMARYNLAAQQLKNCLDSAALAAACSTTGSNATSAAATQTTAMNAAMYMFQQNSILSFPLTSTPAPAGYGITNPSWSPVANQAQLYFEFLDPVTKLPVPYGSSNGKILRVYGSWGFVPITAKFTGLNIGPYVIQDQSDGGLPQLDVVLCFDISASMDDFTYVSLVNRSDNSGVNQYTLPGTLTAVTDPATGTTYKQQGPLYYACNVNNPLGTSVNATFPQDLQYGGTSLPTQGTYVFNVPGHGPNSASAPTYSATQNATYNGGLSFTDLVVNLDGTATMSSGITVNGFTFPADDAATHKGLGILVEASRGNLESVAAAKAAHVPYTTWGITPRTGWFAAYYDAAMSAQSGFPAGAVVPLRHPIGDAIVAAENFFQILNNDADVHFGLVTFASYTGQSYYSLATTDSAVATSVTAAPYPSEPVNIPEPCVPLIPTAGPTYSNYSTAVPPPVTSVNGAMFSPNTAASPPTITTTLMAQGGTNIQGALDNALSQLLGSKPTDAKSTPLGTKAQALSRPGATRAIVLFTDGEPNNSPDVGTTDPQSQSEAIAAKAAGIPIYTIGLCMVPSLQANQTTVLTDAAGSNGIAALSGNGATFSQTTSAAGLTGVFQNVARQLVQLVQ